MISSHASMAVDGSIPSARGRYDLSQGRAFGTLHEGDDLGLLVRAISLGLANGFLCVPRLLCGLDLLGRRLAAWLPRFRSFVSWDSIVLVLISFS
jgi:hypothetical protein